jgi:DNA-binding CsgD family transcriptional regulator
MQDATKSRLFRISSSSRHTARLSTRERQCLELAAQGKSDWEIARILGLAERTVHTHVEKAKRRMQVSTRVQAVVHALFQQQISFENVVSSEPGAAAEATDMIAGLANRIDYSASRKRCRTSEESQYGTLKRQ